MSELEHDPGATRNGNGEASGYSGWSRWLGSWFVTPVAVGAVFFFAGLIALLGDWPAVGDFAVAELVLRHVDRQVPLFGPYSAQHGYHHPLPLVYAIQWVPYHVFGERSAAAAATAVWWNGAMATLFVWILARRNMVALGLLALAALPVLATTLDQAVLVMPWNPSLAIVPGLALVFVAWRVCVGERRLLPLAAGLAMWCAGAHLGFLPLAATIGIAASVSLVAVTVRRGDRGAWRLLIGPGLAAGAVALVMISPMLLDLALDGSESNPARINDSLLLNDAEQSVPASDAFSVLRAELAVPPAWANDNSLPFSVYGDDAPNRIPVLIVPIAIVAVAAWRRRATEELAGMGLSAVALVAATGGLVAVDDSMLQWWYVFPAHVAGIALVSFTVWSGAKSAAAFLERRRPSSAPSRRGRRIPRSVVAPVVGVMIALMVLPTLSTPDYLTSIADSVAPLTRSIDQRFEEGHHLVVDGPLDYDGWYSQALTLQLDKAGYDVRVPDSDLYVYTDAMATPRGWTGTTLIVQLSTGTPESPEPGAVLLDDVAIPPMFPLGASNISVWERDL